ncbi:hypothetical protein ACTWPB_26720 [Nocardia sp. IBHARD005]|uniref:hypothetical protein n=1 Tax=Nocardia sp. IBHARD005 TaxID=3457765 RepID=UPI0040588D48
MSGEAFDRSTFRAATATLTVVALPVFFDPFLWVITAVVAVFAGVLAGVLVVVPGQGRRIGLGVAIGLTGAVIGVGAAIAIFFGT